MPSHDTKTDRIVVQPVHTQPATNHTEVPSAPSATTLPKAQASVGAAPKDERNNLRPPIVAPGVAAQSQLQNGVNRPPAAITNSAVTKTAVQPTNKVAAKIPGAAGVSQSPGNSREASNRNGQTNAKPSNMNSNISPTKALHATTTGPNTTANATAPRPGLSVPISQMPSKLVSTQSPKSVDENQTAPAKGPGGRPTAATPVAPVRPPTGQRPGPVITGPSGSRLATAAAPFPGSHVDRAKPQVAQPQNTAVRPVIPNQPSKPANPGTNGSVINGNAVVRLAGTTSIGNMSGARPASTFSTSTPLQRTLELQARAAAAGSQMNININAAQQQQRLQMQMQQQKQRQQLSAIAQQQNQRPTMSSAQTGNQHPSQMGSGPGPMQMNIDRDVKDEVENERTRLENRERKKRWREANEDRNKDNDLRCRVNKRAHKLFGKEASKTKDLWIEEEFTKRKSKRQEKEGKGPDGHPLVEGVDLINLNPFEMSSVIMATLLEYVCGPVAAATAPKDDPELVSLMKSLKEEPDTIRTLLLGNNNGQSFAIGNGNLPHSDSPGYSPLTTYNMNKMNSTSNEDSTMRDQADDDDDDDMDDDQDMDMDDVDSSQDNSVKAERVDASDMSAVPKQENSNESIQYGRQEVANSKAQSEGLLSLAAIGSNPARRLSISSSGNDNSKFGPYQDASWSIEPQFALALSSDLFRLAVAKTHVPQPRASSQTVKGIVSTATADPYKPQNSAIASSMLLTRPTDARPSAVTTPQGTGGVSGPRATINQQPPPVNHSVSSHGAQSTSSSVSSKIIPTKQQVSSTTPTEYSSHKGQAGLSTGIAQGPRPMQHSPSSASASTTSHSLSHTNATSSQVRGPPAAISNRMATTATLPLPAKVQSVSPSVHPSRITAPAQSALSKVGVNTASKVEEHSTSVPEKDHRPSLAPEAAIKTEIET